MQEIRINEKISYIACAEHPLSSDIGMIRTGEDMWLFDVGNGADRLPYPDRDFHVVLSHFHVDHIGNLGRVRSNTLYVSKETYAHVHCGTVVDASVRIGGLHIFPLPSSHAKGCLGLEVDDTYAFVGDALYCRKKDGDYVYNAQLLHDEIAVLRNLRASLLLVSHFSGLIREKDEVLAELEEIYAQKQRNDPYIRISGSE